MGEKVKLVCETCLSSDRRLVATSRIISVLREIRFEELNSKVICWECHSVIKKFYKFKLQAKHAHIALHDKFQNFKTLSKLLESTKNYYDFEFLQNYDFLTNETNQEEKLEPRIKCENDYDDTEDAPQVHHGNYDNDDKKITIFVDSLQNSKEEIFLKKKICLSKQIKKKLKTKQHFQEKILSNKLSFSHDKSSPKNKTLSSKEKKEIDSVVKEKFETVLLTEEEMLRTREEKRNHPNYKKIPYKCDTCVLGFTRKENYDLHFAKKHNEAKGTHVCNVCSVRFVSAPALARHRTLHYIHYSCTLCAYKTTAMTAASNHCRDKHALDERDRIHCKECTAVFRSSEELSEHARSEHILYCKDCGEKFKGKHTLRAHRVRIHAVKRDFVCEVCKRSFLTKSRLESHMIKHSRALAQRLAYCAVCEVQYKNIQVYRSHLQNNANHAQNRYQCPECNKKFASKIYRTKHYNFYHLNKSQYRCDSCNKLFISEWRLKNHRQKHHGLARSRDHECHDCGKRFYTSTALAVHGATHSSARRHLCARCGAQYRQPAALYTHERRAHADKQTIRACADDAPICTEQRQTL